MPTLPETVNAAWENHQGPIVLVTVSTHGSPNAIYATCVRRHAEDEFVIADNYMAKTRANVLDGSKGSLLFITQDNKSFQLKGTFTYESSGPIYDEMKGWLETRHPGHAAVVLHVEQVYSGSTQLL